MPIETPLSLPFPRGERLLLCAGPRAGKTALLHHWRQACGGPVQVLALGAEDGEAAFFLYRFLHAWPEIRARFEALSASEDAASWSARLGLAIADVHPDFSLLLDNFQAVEHAAIAPELLALYRYFPAEGTLVVASRHHLPALTDATPTVWGAERSLWREQPRAEDLLSLPPPLLAELLAASLVGESPSSPESKELVRRNLADIPAAGLIAARSSWAMAIEHFLADEQLPEETWGRVERALRAFEERHRWTPRARHIREALGRVPQPTREHHPYFLHLEASLLIEEGALPEARGVLARAATGVSDLEAETRLDRWILEASLAQDAPATFSERLAWLDAAYPEASPLQRARIAHLKAAAAWHQGQIAEALAIFEGISALPEQGSRALAYEQFQALHHLHVLHSTLLESAPLLQYAERLIRIATRAGLQNRMLLAHTLRNDVVLRQSQHLVSLKHLFEVPTEAFGHVDQPSWLSYLLGFGTYLEALNAPEAALAVYTLVKARSSAFSQYTDFIHSRLLLIHGQLGQLLDARGYYEALSRQVPQEGRDHLPMYWAIALFKAGRGDEASEVLRRELERPLPERFAASYRFTQLWFAHEAGAPDALDGIHALLETPSGNWIWNKYARLLGRLGLRELPPNFHLRVFGELSVSREDGPPATLQRQHALVLALLALNPAGLSAKELANRVFDRPSDLTGLHRTIYNLRKALGAIGGEGLVEYADGIYCLKWEWIGSCDLALFDACYEKALALEHVDAEAAARFYELALAFMPDEFISPRIGAFDEERARYRARAQRARSERPSLYSALLS